MAKPTNETEYFEVLKNFAAKRGMLFNPDTAIVMSLVRGLWTNKQRYGYPSCPCRLACETLEQDKDIVCPCDYAAPDIEEYGQCYCGLYVSPKVADGTHIPANVPERRSADKMCW